MSRMTDYNGVDRLTKIIDSFNAVVKSIAGKIGLIFFSPITIALVGFLYVKVRRNCRALSSFLGQLRKDAAIMTDREKIETHLELEQWLTENHPRIKYIRSRAGMYGKRFIIGNMLKMLDETNRKMEESEAFFKSAAYPDLNRKFTSEEMDELFHAFEGTGHDFNDWDESDVDHPKPHLID